MPKTPSSVTREHILEVADELFYSRGVRAVGMDEIVRRTGLGKMTIYRQFATKDELVAACLSGRSALSHRKFDAAVARARTPRTKLLEMMRCVADQMLEPDFRGCTFQNTVSEFPDPDHPSRPVVEDYMDALVGRLRDLAAQAGAKRPDRLASELAMLINGAYATARLQGPDEARRTLVPMAKRVLDAHLSPGGDKS